MAAMERMAQQVDAEIELYCHEHYHVCCFSLCLQELVDVVDRLMQLRAEAKELLAQAVDADAQLAQARKESFEDALQQHETNKLLLDAARSIEMLETSLGAVEMCQEVAVLMADRRFFEAIKAIESIEEMTGAVDAPLASQMHEWIHIQRIAIRKAAIAQLHDWLALIRDNDAGKRAITAVQRRLELASNSGFDSLDEEAADLLDSIPVIDVLQAYALHREVQDSGEFSAMLAESRAQQLDILLERPLRIDDADTNVLGDWLAAIAGHFLVDRRLALLPQVGLFTESDRCWSAFVRRLTSIVTDSLHRCRFSPSLIRIKLSLLHFAASLSAVQSPALLMDGVMECITGLYYGYIELLRVEQAGRVRELVLRGALKDVVGLVAEQNQSAIAFLHDIPPAFTPDQQPVFDDVIPLLKESLEAAIDMQADLGRGTAIPNVLKQLDGIAGVDGLAESIHLTLKKRIQTRIDELVCNGPYSSGKLVDLCGLFNSLDRSFLNDATGYAEQRLLELISTLEIDNSLLARLSTDLHRLDESTDSAFRSLTQMTALALSATPHDILDPSVRAAKYSAVDLGRLRVFLSRLNLQDERKRQAIDDLHLLLRN